MGASVDGVLQAGRTMSVVEIPSNALVVLVGPPGCGKSTFARRRFRPTEVVSSDECRRLVADDEADQSATPQAFEVFHAIVRGRLSLGRLAVADATNLHPSARERLRGEAARHGAPVVALALDVPLETCLAQNLGRERQVPAEVIEMHHRQYEEARALLPAEGYHVVHVVRPETEVARVAPVPPPLPAEATPPAEEAPRPALRRVGMLRSRTRRAPGA